MKRLVTLATLLLFACMPAQQAEAVVLFGDTFNRANNAANTPALNESAAGKSGLLGTLDYVTKSISTDKFGIDNNALLISQVCCNGGRGGLVYVDHNLTDAGIVSAGNFSVEVDLAQYSTAGSGRNMGIGVGQSVTELTGQTGVGNSGSPADLFVAYRRTNVNSLEIYKNGTLDAVETVPNNAGLPAAPTSMRIDYSVSDFNAGSNVNYEVFIDGAAAAFTSGSFAWSGTNENFVSLSTNLTNDARFDNLAISTDISQGSSKAVAITTNTGTNGVSGQVDVDDGGSFGGTQFHAKNAGANSGFTRKGYMRFDVSSLTTDVEFASLDLQIASIQNQDKIISVFGLTDESLDNWDPNTTDYANAPGNDVSSGAAADLSEATFLGTLFSPSATVAGDILSFSSAALTEFLNADTNGLVTIFITRSGGNLSRNFLPAGDTHPTFAPPTLSLIVASVPEPATATLALLGLGGLVMRRRRNMPVAA